MSDVNVRAEVIQAMECIFGLAEAVNDGNVTIGELEDVIRLAVQDGHERIMLALAMVSCALQRVTQDKAG